MRIVNLTPHDINIYSPNGEVILKTFPSEGTIRVEASKSKIYINDFPSFIPLFSVKISEASSKETLPEEIDGVMYIVSSVVQETHKHRKDFLCPNTSGDNMGAVRDERGRIIGTKSFVING